jgi:acetyl-CoA C-acetyltransferase
MTGRVGIIGIGETPYDRVDDRSFEEVVHAASRAALSDAELDRQAVDNLVVCASDLDDGRAISSMVAAGPAGGYRRDFIKSTDTGIHALGLASMRMEVGLFDTTLVVTWGKQSETDLQTIRPLEAAPFYHRGTGLGYGTGHAVKVTAYMEAHEGAMTAADHVVAKNTRNARDAPDGSTPDPVSVEEAGDSELVSWPVRDAHLPPVSDGACALVLATEEAARNRARDPVWIEGLGWETDSYYVGTRSEQTVSALGGAARRAYDGAGIDPTTDVDLFEFHTPTAYHELIAAEAADACGGPATDAVMSGEFDRSGPTPVNPSGGPFAGNPLMATGLARVAAATRQLRGDAGDVQVADSDRAVAHSTAGFTDQVHGMAVLAGDRA